VATTKGLIKAISISKRKGTQKVNVPTAQLQADFGIVGDAHAGNWHRQVSLLSFESIDEIAAKGAEVLPGDFAENITTEDIDLHTLKPGDKLRLGENVELEITQSGKRCHQRCKIFERLGDCIMPKEGIFAKVIKGGIINTGDAIEVIHDKNGRIDNQ
jgi:MOSC domain-containing protein YiiM